MKYDIFRTRRNYNPAMVMAGKKAPPHGDGKQNKDPAIVMAEVKYKPHYNYNPAIVMAGLNEKWKKVVDKINCGYY